MKKRIWQSAAAVLLMALLAGCGAEDETNADLKEMAVDKYVTLGDYGSLDVAVAGAKVDEKQCDQLLYAVYLSNVTKENGGITDRPAAEGDTVIIDYEGRKDGVAFAGGTDSDVQLTIGSGGFIEGFEEGLVGVMPGETVELALTFPENYRNPDLAGQAVTFTVTVHYICPSADNMEDSVVAALGIPEVDTVAALRQYVYDYLMESAEQNYQYNLQNAVMERLLAVSQVEELPETFVDSYKHMFIESNAGMAAANGMDAETYAYSNYGMGSEEYAAVSAQAQARQEVVLQAIANKEGLGVGDEELQEKLEEYARQIGVTVEEMLGTFSREEYRNYFMSEKVMNFLLERANITQE